MASLLKCPPKTPTTGKLEKLSRCGSFNFGNLTWHCLIRFSWFLAARGTMILAAWFQVSSQFPSSLCLWSERCDCARSNMRKMSAAEMRSDHLYICTYIYVYLLDTNTYIQIYSINSLTFANPYYPKPSRSFTARFLLEGHSLELEAAWGMDGVKVVDTS